MKPVVAATAERVTPRLLHWAAYSPAVKCDLSSAAYRTDDGWVLVDPILLAPEAEAEAFGGETPVAVVLTNGNHARAADAWRARLGIPVYAPAAATDLEAAADFPLGETVHGLRVLPIPGATEGETAFLSGDGVLFLGDAVINLESGGLALLPKKYAWDEKESRASLRTLLDLDFSLVCFAHGTPLRSGAKERLRQLLA